MMLKNMGLESYGNKIEASVFKVMKEGKYLTGDLGGKAKTTEYTKAIIDNLWKDIIIRFDVKFCRKWESM